MAKRITGFRAENADDLGLLVRSPKHQQVKIKVPARSRPEGEAGVSAPTPEQPRSEAGPQPIPAEPEATPVTSSTPSAFSDQLRAIIRRDGRAVYAIETAAGVPRGGVGRSLAGQRGLTTDTLDRLALVLGFRVAGPNRGD